MTEPEAPLRCFGLVSFLNCTQSRLRRIVPDSTHDSESWLPMTSPATDFAVRVSSLSYSYPGAREVLRNISFEVARREIVGLVGPSGAGKSTLLMHINGLLPERLDRSREPARIEVCGLPVQRPYLDRVRQLVGFVFQDPDDQLFCPTVREDVAFGPLNLGLDQRTVLERVQHQLERVGLAGYEHRSTLQLSVGEKKRVCLAGVLASEPEVLVLDEPFSNLDPRARRSLMAILRDFPGSQLIATHDLDLAVELCHRVIVLDGGEVRACGATRTVLSDPVLMDQHGLEVPYQLR